jgi:hypothetical protein
MIRACFFLDPAEQAACPRPLTPEEKAEAAEWIEFPCEHVMPISFVPRIGEGVTFDGDPQPFFDREGTYRVEDVSHHYGGALGHTVWIALRTVDLMKDPK